MFGFDWDEKWQGFHRAIDYENTLPSTYFQMVMKQKKTR